MKLNRDQILKLMTYDPDTGKFLWLERTAEFVPNEKTRNTFNKLYAGKPVGTIDSVSKSRRCTMFGKLYYVKSIAFLIMTGEWPEVRTSHIDGDNTNLRWNNLCTEKDLKNAKNEMLAEYETVRTVLPGVVYSAHKEAYRAFINIAFVTMPAGYFRSPTEAVEDRGNRMMEMGI